MTKKTQKEIIEGIQILLHIIEFHKGGSVNAADDKIIAAAKEKLFVLISYLG